MSKEEMAVQAVKMLNEKCNRINPVLKIIVQIMNQVETLNSQISADKEDRSPMTESSCKEILTTFLSIIIALKDCIRTLYNIFTDEDLPYFAKETVEEIEKEVKEAEGLLEIFDVSVVVSEDKVFVKLPKLWSKYTTLGSKDLYAKRRSYSNIMRRELEKEFNKKLNQIPRFDRKHIAYLFVTAKGKTSPDADNFDTKVITDTVSFYCGGTDSAATTSFSYIAIPEGALLKGTYICVSNHYGNPPGLEALIEDFRKVF